MLCLPIYTSTTYLCDCTMTYFEYIMLTTSHNRSLSWRYGSCGPCVLLELIVCDGKIKIKML